MKTTQENRLKLCEMSCLRRIELPVGVLRKDRIRNANYTRKNVSETGNWESNTIEENAHVTLT